MNDDPSQYLRKTLKLKEPPALAKLHGDASNRIYYRTQLEGKSVIVMQLPPGAASISEEITRRPSKELPFINIQRYLHRQGLPVPQILHASERVLVLEDLGTKSLESFVLSSEKDRLHWYRQAVDLLIQMQNNTPPDPSCIAFARSFDDFLLNWEFDHFLEYGIEVRQGICIDRQDRKQIKQGMNFVTYALLQLPQAFVHRDFQSRNLMVHQDRLVLIDFQDALMGPFVYDLVALLRDSYVTLRDDEMEFLIDYYLKSRPCDPVFFRKMFDWMTIQRKLKDVGRFIYIDRVKQNPNFLPYVTPSLQYVREALERQPELAPLKQVLAKYVPEFL